MPRLFISYRRDDSAGFAGRLSDALESRFGAGSVFRDVDDIKPGTDFAATIQQGLQKVDAVLVVIGPRWLIATSGGERRLDCEDDFVRREIEHALASGKPVVPVLVGGAAMPSGQELPMSIRGLAARQALTLDDTSWNTDIDRLAATLSPWLQAEGVAQVSGRLLVAIVCAAILLCLVAFILLRPDSGAQLQAFAGSWQARVTYPWGVTADEHFELAVRNGVVEGRAGFLGVARAIEQSRWDEGELNFQTRSATVVGRDSPQELIHDYSLRMIGEELHVRYETRGDYRAQPVVEFVARRTSPQR